MVTIRNYSIQSGRPVYFGRSSLAGGRDVRNSVYCDRHYFGYIGLYLHQVAQPTVHWANASVTGGVLCNSIYLGVRCWLDYVSSGRVSNLCLGTAL